MIKTPLSEFSQAAHYLFKEVTTIDYTAYRSHNLSILSINPNPKRSGYAEID